MDLPKNESVFEFEHVGATTGRKYEGRFTVRCILNIAQKHAMELEKTKLRGGSSNPTDALAGIAIILATLHAKIVDSPEWWKQGQGSDLLDEDVLVVLHDKVEDAEVAWKKALTEKATQS